MTVSDIELTFEKILSCDVVSISRVGAGRNSQVFRIVCSDGRVLAAKLYSRCSSDPRDRLAVEYRSLDFLRRNGIRSVPCPVSADHLCGIAFYQFIDGSVVDSRKANENEIEQIIEFLLALDKLKVVPEAVGLPIASEACFSVNSIIRSISDRLARLSTVPSDGIMCDGLLDFLSEFREEFARTSGRARRRLEEKGVSFDYELPMPERTLSPSDLGFHNALKTPDGKLVFLDFEYFGWDDPAKTISDFILHPAMELSGELKMLFVRRMMNHFDRSGLLSARLGAVYPLWGLKWCMILLNEFVNVHSVRRAFAATVTENVEEIRARQLAKASSMLKKVQKGYDQF